MIQLTKPLHHAYGIAGDATTVVPELLAELKNRVGFVAKGNPDYWYGDYQTLGIDEAREIKELAGRQAVTDGKKVFVISARALTREAQNALLKILEEPTPDTLFFLIVPTVELLLSTLRSRVVLLRGTAFSPDTSSARAFLSASVPVRLKKVQQLLKTMEEGEDGRETIRLFFDQLERASAAGNKAARAAELSEILEVKKYSRDRAPSFKLLLEHVALVLPRM